MQDSFDGRTSLLRSTKIAKIMFADEYLAPGIQFLNRCIGPTFQGLQRYRYVLEDAFRVWKSNATCCAAQTRISVGNKSFKAVIIARSPPLSQISGEMSKLAIFILASTPPSVRLERVTGCVPRLAQLRWKSAASNSP